MLLRVINLINESKVLWIPSAGGDAGLSMIRHLEDSKLMDKDKVHLQDNDTSVVRFFRKAGYNAQGTISNVGKGTGVILPSADYIQSYMPKLYGDTEYYQYEKVASHNILNGYKDEFVRLQLPPHLVGSFGLIVRGSESSGSKDTHIYNSDVIASKKINNGVEYVVDYNLEAKMFVVRETQHLKAGRDTRVVVLNDKSITRLQLIEATIEGADALNCTFGNMQFIHATKTDEIFFIENSPRLSGSSWVNLLTGNNILTGVSSPIPEDVYAHTSHGLL